VSDSNGSPVAASTLTCQTSTTGGGLELLLGKFFVLLIPDHGLFTMATAWLNKFRTILSH